MIARVKYYLELLHINMCAIARTAIAAGGVLYAIASTILSFISWEDIGIDNKVMRITILLGIGLLAIIVGMFITIFRTSKKVMEQGNATVFLEYGDIIKSIFPRKNPKEKCVIVVPVNTEFDTTVGNGIISENTIHGKWLNREYQAGLSQQALDEQISEALKGVHADHLSKKDKPRGNNLRYPIGTIAMLSTKFSNIRIYLLALSTFDKNNVAKCTKQDQITCIEKLIEYHNNHGQGDAIYMPLIGMGLSGAESSHTEAVDTLLSVIKLNRELIRSDCHIVIYNKERNRYSI